MADDLLDNPDLMLVIQRGERMARRFGIRLDRLTVIMDLHNVDRQCGLDLSGMLGSDDGDFAHDFFGIRQHMDRETGKLTDCFVPRFARQ